MIEQPLVTVITATTGSDFLYDALLSVKKQTYKNLEHYVVIDGIERKKEALKILKNFPNVKLLTLPYATGKDNYNGHRIYAAATYLSNGKYVSFLDEDNYYEPNHVASCVNLISQGYDWVYNLRNIIDKDKNFICEDNCESLGRWPVWVNKDAFLIDSSSYCFKREFLQEVGHLWHHGWGADRRFYTIIKEEVGHKNYGCSSRYTLNYRLGGNEGSVQSDFFIEGNKQMEEKYQGNYPWSIIHK
jgi:glycosyltransferase involved in cell wall biosynthesis